MKYEITRTTNNYECLYTEIIQQSSVFEMKLSDVGYSVKSDIIPILFALILAIVAYKVARL